MISGKQINRLGDRLRDADMPATEDLDLLSEVLASYEDARLAVHARLADRGFTPTSRLKTTNTIIDKLRRERGAGYALKLKKIHDIAGARIVVDGHFHNQDLAVDQIVNEFSDEQASEVLDRRLKPNSGYRAVHVIVRTGAVPV
ncbi:MAG: hypothetical protein ACREP9_14755, partial [Candidatus Dormibacteraceae bacterium]